MKIENLTPLQRRALLAALAAKEHSLHRVRGGYACLSCGVKSHAIFTFRLMRMLDRAYLVQFDDPSFPSRATLTSNGVALAEQLRDGTDAAQAAQTA